MKKLLILSLLACCMSQGFAADQFLADRHVKRGLACHKLPRAEHEHQASQV